jgi:trigger factor
MKVEWRREAPSRAVLEVEVPAEEVSRGVSAAAARLARRVRVPGFRPGKAPRTVLERYLGRDELYAEAAESLVSSAYHHAVHEVGVVPVGRPEFEVAALDETKPLTFTATVDVNPEVEPGAYEQIRVPFEATQVGDTEVDAAIEEIRRRRGKLVSVPGAKAEAGDFVLIRPSLVEGTDRFQGGREVLVELGAGVYPEGIEDAFLGAGVGEDREAAAFGEGGKLTATVVDVKRRELPPVDDAFAKAVGDVDSVAALRERLRDRLAADASTRAEDAYEERVLTTAIDGATIELPVSLVEHEIDHIVGELAESLQRRGFTLERYLASAEKDIAGLREEMRPRAERRLKMRFVLDEIARREGLVPTQEEIAAEEEKVAADLKLDAPRVNEWLDGEGRREALLSLLRRRKTVQHLIARARSGSA